MGLKSVGGQFSWVFFVFPMTLACVQKVTPPADTSTTIPTYQAPETDYCSPITSTGVTISGSAGFQYRVASATGLGSVIGPKPIRRAEVRVKNSAGTLVQCTETDWSGNFSFIVPSGSSPLTVQVTSRSDNNDLKAYVYDDPRYNNYYAVSATFTPSSSQSIGSMVASATGSTVAGAFNILDQFLDANEYLRGEVGNCSSTFGACPDFTVADRVTAYWKLGFTPASYYNEPTYGISFYLPGYSRLFILGGIGGDSDSEDTDHFDNSVILHEYGHFLEDTLFQSDSPGGQHDADSLVDPRLAWSEGWGNFFQGAVRNTANYIDTEGNADGPFGTSAIIYRGLENQSADVAQYDGEGNFREFSVTRLLWDAIDTNVDSVTNTVGGYGSKSDNISGAFNQIYYVLTSTSMWKRGNLAFRQIGHLHLFQSLLGTTSWDNIVKMEGQKGDSSDYGQYVTASGSCSYSMNPRRVAVDLMGANYLDDGDDGYSHLLLNNDLYHLRVTSTQNSTFSLSYTDLNGGSLANLDLIIWNEDAEIYYLSTDWIARSQTNPSGGGPYLEGFTVNLAPGNYLINVRGNTKNMIAGSTDYTTYTLKLNGSDLCPTFYP